MNDYVMHNVWKMGSSLDRMNDDNNVDSSGRRQRVNVHLNTFSRPVMANFHSPETNFLEMPPHNDATNQIQTGQSHEPKLRKLAYHLIEGEKRPTLLYVGGFRSTMQIHKSRAVEKLAVDSGHSAVTFDWEGVGQSSGELTELVLTDWIYNVECIIGHVCPPGPVLIIASSFGGWVSLSVASRNRFGLTTTDVADRICGLVLIGPFLMSYSELFDKMREKGVLTETDKLKMVQGESIVHETPYGTAYISQRLIDDSKPFESGLRAVHANGTSNTIEIYEEMKERETKKLDVAEDASADEKPVFDIRCPLRILNVIDDNDTPWDRTPALLRCVTSSDVDLIVRKDGNHRLMKQRDLTLIGRTICNLVDDLASQYDEYKHNPDRFISDA